MKIDKLNHWLALAANLGVLVGLMVLIVEINQNTRVAEIESYQTLIEQIMVLNRDQYSDPELFEVMRKVNLGEESITQSELLRYRMYTLSLIRHGDLAYLQYLNGLIDEERLNSALTILVAWIQRSDQAWAVWQGNTQFDADFKAYIERQVAEHPLGN